MERAVALLRELLDALGLPSRAAEIEPVATGLIRAYLAAGGESSVPEHRARRMALAACYLAGNHVILPDSISYARLSEAAASVPAWQEDGAPGVNGMLRIVTRFARRLCPAEHVPETIVRGGWEYTSCTRCYAILSGTEVTTKRGRRKAVHLPNITTPIRVRWGNAALRHARDLVKAHPALQPAIPGAMVLLRRYIDQTVTTWEILGPMLVKVVKMSMLHEAKAMDIPISTSDLDLLPGEYLQFLASVGASTAQPSSTGDAAILDQTLRILAEYTGRAVDEATRDRVERFQKAVRRKLMGFSPATVAGIIAYIDLARYHGEAVAIRVGSIAGTGQSSMHNSIVRFLRKIGRPGDPSAPLIDRVRAAFPP